MINIYPSLISADLLNLEKEIKLLEPYCAGFHIDVMDNHFVPNLTWGKMFIDAIGEITKKPLWVHLMIDNPSIFIDSLVLSPGSMLTFHIESVSDVKKISCRIKEKNIIPSIAVSPKTPIEKIFPFLDLVDHILIMTVEPGFSGQCFLKNSINKIETLFSYVNIRKLKVNDFRIRIFVDGGVGRENIRELVKIGVSDFAIGSGIFDYENRVEAIKKLYELV